MNSRDGLSDDPNPFQFDPRLTRRSGRSSRLTLNVLKALLVVGVAWVALTVAFTVVGVLTAGDGNGSSEASTVPGSSQIILPDAPPIVMPETP